MARAVGICSRWLSGERGLAEATGVVHGRETALRPGPFPAASRAQDAPGQRSQLRLPGLRQFLLPQGGQHGYPPPHRPRPGAPRSQAFDGCQGFRHQTPWVPRLGVVTQRARGGHRGERGIVPRLTGLPLVSLSGDHPLTGRVSGASPLKNPGNPCRLTRRRRTLAGRAPTMTMRRRGWVGGVPTS